MMNAPVFRLRNAPIVEAVFDIECDLPPGFDLAALEAHSRERFKDQYPKFRVQFMQQHKIEMKADEYLR